MDAGPLTVPSEDAMFSCLLLSAALTLGQTPAAPDTAASTPPAPVSGFYPPLALVRYAAWGIEHRRLRRLAQSRRSA